MTAFVIVLGCQVLIPGQDVHAQSYEKISRLTLTLDRYEVRIKSVPGNSVILRESDDSTAFLEIEMTESKLDIHQQTGSQSYYGGW